MQQSSMGSIILDLKKKELVKPTQNITTNLNFCLLYEDYKNSEALKKFKLNTAEKTASN